MNKYVLIVASAAFAMAGGLQAITKKGGSFTGAPVKPENHKKLADILRKKADHHKALADLSASENELATGHEKKLSGIDTDFHHALSDLFTAKAALHDALGSGKNESEVSKLKADVKKHYANVYRLQEKLYKAHKRPGLREKVAGKVAAIKKSVKTKKARKTPVTSGTAAA